MTFWHFMKVAKILLSNKPINIVLCQKKRLLVKQLNPKNKI